MYARAIQRMAGFGREDTKSAARKHLGFRMGRTAMRALRRMLTITVLVFFGIGLRLFQPAHAQEPPPEPLILQKLLASTGAASDRLGAALAVSGDVLVATAPGTTVDGKRLAGAAYLFLRNKKRANGSRSNSCPKTAPRSTSSETRRPSTAIPWLSALRSRRSAASSSKVPCTSSSAIRAVPTTGARSQSSRKIAPA